jgi:hypothetical protein
MPLMQPTSGTVVHRVRIATSKRAVSWFFFSPLRQLLIMPQVSYISGTVVYPFSTANFTSSAVGAAGTSSGVWAYSPTTSSLVGVYTGSASANMVCGALFGVAGVAAMVL